MALGPSGIARVTRSLDRLLDLLGQQQAAALHWQTDALSAVGDEAVALQQTLAGELPRADARELAELAPRLRQAQQAWRANRDIIGQALGLVREWRRILSGAEAISYDRSGRPVETGRTAAGGRVA